MLIHTRRARKTTAMTTPATHFIGPLAFNQVELLYVPASTAASARRSVMVARMLKRFIAVEVAGYGELRFNRETGRCTDPNLKFLFSIARTA